MNKTGDNGMNDAARKALIILAAIILIPGHPVAFIGGLLLTMKYGVSHVDGDILWFYPWAFPCFAWLAGASRAILFRVQVPSRTGFWKCIEAFVYANVFCLAGLIPAALFALSKGFNDMVFIMFIFPWFLLAAIIVVPLTWRRSRKQILKLKDSDGG
jgi:hypothetical protein